MFILLQISLYSYSFKSCDKLYLQMTRWKGNVFVFLKCLWRNFRAQYFPIDAASDKKNLNIKQHMLNEQMPFPWKQIESSSNRKTK